MVLLTMRVTTSTKQREEVLRTLRSATGAITTLRGCIGLHLMQDVDNRSAITLCEEWETEADLRRHVRSDDFRTLLAVIDMSMTKPEVRFHTVTGIQGMEWIAKERTAI